MAFWGRTVVAAHCVICGQVQIDARQITLNVCVNRPELNSYRFDCPTCRQQVKEAACVHVVSVLLTVGVQVERWEIPGEALESHDGPPIGHDDLLDLHEQLETL